MGHIEMGQAFIAAHNSRQWDIVANYLTDDFTWTGAALGAMGKQAYVAVQQAWAAAAPDYHLTLENAREDGDIVQSTTGQSGTQTNPLVLPGRPAIPATGKHWSSTYATTTTWRGDKIAAVSTGPSTPNVFEQLSVQPPA